MLMLIKQILTATLLLMCFVSTAQSADLESTRKQAMNGDAECQYLLGIRLLDSNHGPSNRNLKEAANWLTKAAEQGHTKAQYSLASLLSHTVSNRAAFKWYNKAAEKGHAGAQFTLGAMFEHGRGADQNIDKAVMWYRKSADQYYGSSQFALGRLFYSGCNQLRYESKSGVETKEVSVLERNYSKAFEWFSKAADQCDAQFGIGMLYYRGDGVKQDRAKAEKWIKKALTNWMFRPTDLRYWQSIFNVQIIPPQTSSKSPKYIVIDFSFKAKALILELETIEDLVIDSDTDLDLYLDRKTFEASKDQTSNKAVELDPNLARAYYSRGVAYEEKGDIAVSPTSAPKNTLGLLRQKGIDWNPDLATQACEPDGAIILVDNMSGVVQINVGKKDHVCKGLTFSVFDKGTIVKSKDAFKAEIEVVGVAEQYSMACVIKSNPDNPVSIDDAIANLVWSAGEPKRFVLAGSFDLDGDHFENADAAVRIMSLIRRWGGVVESSVKANTDYVIIGSKPKVPAKPTFKTLELDPLAEDRYNTAVQRLSIYTAVKESAQLLMIPTFEYNKFLYLIGYTGQIGKPDAF